MPQTNYVVGKEHRTSHLLHKLVEVAADVKVDLRIEEIHIFAQVSGLRL
jgi:hypothetical protein